MDMFRSCQDYVYSEKYAAYYVETGGNTRDVEEIYRADCLQVINENFVTFRDFRYFFKILCRNFFACGFA